MAPSSPVDLLEEKRALRREMGKERAALSAVERRARGAAACARLLELPELAALAGRTVAGYVALDAHGELDPAPALEAVAARGGQVALPRVSGPAAALTFHLAGGAALVRGRFGLFEPPPEAAEIEPPALDVVVVPGVAFDGSGRRLGFGGGYYDRTFGADAVAERRPPLIGLCFDLQVVPRCPAGPDDVAVDVVVTESRVLRREGVR
ncbi:MAG TPA: 5-formyltetrahydrofolate cyclo-ligase [Polyangia bacterium]|nr:5-formyltetrahydrofolate cyclo-ligase [Polyangia bacterium]